MLTPPHNNNTENRQEGEFFGGSEISSQVSVLSEETISSMIRLGQILRKIHIRIFTKGYKIKNIKIDG